MDNRRSSFDSLARLLVATLPALFACGEPPAGGGGFSPMAAEVVTLEPAPIERATDTIATLKSRRSTTLQPMTDGIVSRIVARSGDRVRAGDPVLEIESSRQRATVAALESRRAARAAEVSYARSEAERQRALLESGFASPQDFDRARAALESAEGLLRAAEAEFLEQTVELAYHRVTAPTAGQIGDVPIRVGDRVTTSTVLTTIDSGGGLELYLRLPVGSAGGLRRGLPVRIVDDAGAVRSETAIDFVSQQVDERTQTVLAKAPLPEASGFRTEQQVRARVIWSAEPGLRVPVVAVSRIGGQFFAFVAEEAEGKTVARQKAVRLGPIVGNDYVLLEGLAAGDRLIVSGIQKIRDGAPVDAKPKASPGRG